MEESQYTELRDRVSVEYNRVERNSGIAIVQRIKVERIIFEQRVVAPHELPCSEVIEDDVADTSSRSLESSCDVLTRSCCCESVYNDHSYRFNEYCSRDSNSYVLDYIRNLFNAARLTSEATITPCIEMTCPETACNDTLLRSICYQSILDDTNTCNNCHHCYSGSADMSNIQTIPDLLGTFANTQQRTERTTAKIEVKTSLGRIFTEHLMNLCNISIKAIYDERSAVNDSAVNKQYMDTVIELVDAIIILTLIKHKFCSIGAGQERQSDEMLQYVLLPILLGTAKKAADITKTTLQSFWRNLLPSDVGILLSTCSGMAQVVNGAKDIDSKTLREVTDIIQQLKDCLDKINVFKNFNNISLRCIASMCSEERLSMELSIGQ